MKPCFEKLCCADADVDVDVDVDDEFSSTLLELIFVSARERSKILDHRHCLSHGGDIHPHDDQAYC